MYQQFGCDVVVVVGGIDVYVEVVIFYGFGYCLVVCEDFVVCCWQVVWGEGGEFGCVESMCDMCQLYGFVGVWMVYVYDDLYLVIEFGEGGLYECFEFCGVYGGEFVGGVEDEGIFVV